MESEGQGEGEGEGWKVSSPMIASRGCLCAEARGGGEEGERRRERGGENSVESQALDASAGVRFCRDFSHIFCSRFASASMNSRSACSRTYVCTYVHMRVCTYVDSHDTLQICMIRTRIRMCVCMHARTSCVRVYNICR